MSEYGTQSTVSDSDDENDILGPDEDIKSNQPKVVEEPKNAVVPNTQEIWVTKVTIPPSDIKSKNAMRNPKSYC